MREAMITISDLKKSYFTSSAQKVIALDNINLMIEKGEFVSFIGPSGCGKSTLLRIISGLENFQEGKMNFAGNNKGFVFQDSALLPWKTVYQNIIFPLEIKQQMTEIYLDNVKGLIELVGLDAFRNALPKELSGGMKQRVSIARSLSYNPDVLMMDEPFGALDAMTRDSLNIELRKIWHQSNKTILFVTHDIEEAVFLSTKVVVLSSRPGTIKEIVSIDLDTNRDLSIRSSEKFNRFISYLREVLEQ
ncbi:ABC transporter ATP-binding protein [Enterococcus songbeiensis]|uniref:ABC transporter ATP-binding protein n=1 Tax=Enterococcus songbeiensis TaxID=2559927 RepID=UPI0010F49C31|nr:ABC transporter ATP-binding protein [Enterococcus songbeiensis]